MSEDDPYAIVFIRFLFPSIVALPLLVKTFNIHMLDRTLIETLVFLVPLELLATICYIKAISISPLSLTIPFLSFTPMFLLFTSYVMLGEVPSHQGILGVILITLGAYLLHLERPEPLYPFKAVKREKGSQLMMITAFLYSITSNLGKICIKATSPEFFAAFYLPVLTLSFVPVLKLRRIEVSSAIKPSKGRFIIGAFIASSFFCHTNALNLTLVPYAISVKRTSLLFAIIYGSLLFKEKGLLRKLLAGSVMLLGVFLVSLTR